MKEHYLLDTETVKTYLVEQLRLFSPMSRSVPRKSETGTSTMYSVYVRASAEKALL